MRTRKDPHLNTDTVPANDEINASIIDGSTEDLSRTLRGALNSMPREIAVENATIIDDDLFGSTTPKKKFKARQWVILGLTAVFAVGGVASIFLPEVPNPVKVSQVSQAPRPNPTTESTTANLPASLAPTGELANAAAVPPVKTEAEAPKPVAPSAPVVAAPATQPPAQAQAATPPAQPSGEAKPQQRSPVPPKVAETVPAPNPTPEAKPVAAKAAPKAANAPASVDQKTFAAAAARDKPRSASADAPVVAKSEPKPAVVTTRPTHSAKTKDAPVQPKQALASDSAEQPPALTREAGDESVKKLVTITPDEFGLQSVDEGSITLQQARNGYPQKLAVGDRLPNGERILRIDARSMTLVSDRSVIRFK